MDVSKNICDGERLFFWNEAKIQSLLCKNIDIFLNYEEVGVYLKNSTPHSTVETSKNVVKSGCF